MALRSDSARKRKELIVMPQDRTLTEARREKALSGELKSKHFPREEFGRRPFSYEQDSSIIYALYELLNFNPTRHILQDNGPSNVKVERARPANQI